MILDGMRLQFTRLQKHVIRLEHLELLLVIEEISYYCTFQQLCAPLSTMDFYGVLEPIFHISLF